LASGRPRRAPSPPSPTSSPSFGVRLLSCLSSFSSPWMLHLLLPACLPRYSTAATFSQTRHHHRRRRLFRGDGAPYRPTLRRRVRVSHGLPVGRYRHPLPSVLCGMTITPFVAVCLLRESPCFVGRLPEYEHCSKKNVEIKYWVAVNVFYAARLRCPVSKNVPVFFRFFFISESRYCWPTWTPVIGRETCSVLALVLVLHKKIDFATLFYCSWRSAWYQICDIWVTIACGIRGGQTLGWCAWTSSYC